MSHKEIELKVMVLREVFEELKKRLTQIGEVLPVLKQDDFYLDNTQDSFFGPNKNGDPQRSLRIRAATDKNTICLKVAHKGEKENNYYREEFEIQINSSEHALCIFSQLGYTVVKTIKKTRFSFTIVDYEVTLDELEGIAPTLSYVVELEYKKSADDHECVIDQMEEFLQNTLGVTAYEKIMHGIEKYVK